MTGIKAQYDLYVQRVDEALTQAGCGPDWCKHLLDDYEELIMRAFVIDRPAEKMAQNIILIEGTGK